MTGAVTWEMVAGFMALATFFGGYWWRFQGQVSKLHERVNRLRDELSAYKLESSQKFVSLQHMEHLENRMISAINRLGDRLDRIFEKGKSRE